MIPSEKFGIYPSFLLEVTLQQALQSLAVTGSLFTFTLLYEKRYLFFLQIMRSNYVRILDKLSKSICE